MHLELFIKKGGIEAIVRIILPECLQPHCNVLALQHGYDNSGTILNIHRTKLSYQRDLRSYD